MPILDVVEQATESSTESLPMHRRLQIAMGDIKLAHSVFAMPFAILGGFLVAPKLTDTPEQLIDWPSFSIMLLLIVICMFFARNWAMLVNRVADAKIDADNPRTSKRAFASGKLNFHDGFIFLAVNSACFIIACSLFGILFHNWWPTILGVPVLIWIGFYSFTKRFTWLCHIFLGGALAASPIAAAIAVGPHDIPTTLAVFPLAVMVLSWVAGFDIIYALQDLEYDQEVGLSSIPSRFGWKRAVWFSRVLHILAIASLIFAWKLEPRFGMTFIVATGFVGCILIYEHQILAQRGKAGIPMAFFTLNGIVSIILGISGCLDLLI
ncbi:MAG: putative 4-hydroxybenzoate polyprenyltransferase [Phycisphaerales bacterium]|nr:putative 4-hydroxybenzoate polyprenyltransferase [Phycisphaerales bacterium]